MADAKRNSLVTDHLQENRNQRTTKPQQPGATGTPDRELSPEDARAEAQARYGKTDKTTSRDD